MEIPLLMPNSITYIPVTLFYRLRILLVVEKWYLNLYKSFLVLCHIGVYYTRVPKNIIKLLCNSSFSWKVTCGFMQQAAGTIENFSKFNNFQDDFFLILKRFFWSNMNYISMFVILKYDTFNYGFSTELIGKQ